MVETNVPIGTQNSIRNMGLSNFFSLADDFVAEIHKYHEPPIPRLSGTIEQKREIARILRLRAQRRRNTA